MCLTCRKARRRWTGSPLTTDRQILSNNGRCAIIRPLPWSGIEVVITGLTRNQFVGQPARGFESHPLRQQKLLPFKGRSFMLAQGGKEPTCPRGKGAECQHSVLSGEAGNEASLLARKGERNPLQGFQATIERTEFESRRAPTRQKNRPLVFKEQKLSIEYDYVIVDTLTSFVYNRQ